MEKLAGSRKGGSKSLYEVRAHRGKLRARLLSAILDELVERTDKRAGVCLMVRERVTFRLNDFPRGVWHVPFGSQLKELAEISRRENPIDDCVHSGIQVKP